MHEMDEVLAALAFRQWASYSSLSSSLSSTRGREKCNFCLLRVTSIGKHRILTTLVVSAREVKWMEALFLPSYFATLCENNFVSFEYVHMYACASKQEKSLLVYFQLQFLLAHPIKRHLIDQRVNIFSEQ